jgi:hypothetical protein
MLWWYGAMRVPESPSFDASPPPAALEAIRPASAASAASAATAAPRAAPAFAIDTPGPDGMITETADDAARPARTSRANPEPRAPATVASDAAPASRRVQAAARPTPRAPAAAPAFRTAAERCADRSLVARSICQSRECARPEHANEPMCQRIRAAEDRRREP